MGKAKAGDDRYAKTVTLFNRLVATNPEIERKRATMPYTAVNGEMFSVLDKTGTLALRLPAGEREQFLKRFDTQLTRQYGVVRPEYVDVPDALLEKTQTLKKYFDVSYEYARALKPKPTSKEKKKNEGGRDATQPTGIEPRGGGTRGAACLRRLRPGRTARGSRLRHNEPNPAACRVRGVRAQ
jgi:hypothetical protein